MCDKTFSNQAWCKAIRCDSLHSVRHKDRVMNRSLLGKGKDRQLLVGKSSGKSDDKSGTVQRSYILHGA
jgi:hypothetical protein